MSELDKLRWRCRRGMRELDTLMLAWLDTHYHSADAATRTKFKELLELQDPDIIALLQQYDNTDEVDRVRSSEISAMIDKTKSSKESGFESIILQAKQAGKSAAMDSRQPNGKNQTKTSKG